jgi:hypothetical protein
MLGPQYRQELFVAIAFGQIHLGVASPGAAFDDEVMIASAFGQFGFQFLFAGALVVIAEAPAVQKVPRSGAADCHPDKT